MKESPTIDVSSETQALAVRGAEQVAITSRQEDYAGLMAMAKELCTTGFLPAAVKTPAQAVAIILTGRELGLGPMQSLRSICIIQGKPELAADLQLSIFHRDGGRSKWLALTEQKAVLWLRHPNGDEHTESFTMEDARRAGLAGGQNWLKYPKAMLRSRAITAGLKSIGFEPLAGAYAPGEIGGPEIVGPEPETVAENPENDPKQDSRQKPTPTVGSGATLTGRAMSGHPPAQAQGQPPPAGQATAKPAQSPSGPPVYAGPKKRQWMIDELEKAQLLAHAPEFCRKLENPCWLMDNEGIDELPFQYVPLDIDQLRLLKAAITDFSNGDSAVHPYAPNPLPPPAEKPKVANVSRGTSKVNPTPMSPSDNVSKRDPEWWRDIIWLIPPAGVKLDEYLKNPQTVGQLYDDRHNPETAKRLFGTIAHFEPQPTWTGNDGQVRQTAPDKLKAQEIFREALDACDEYAKKHHGDTEERTPLD